MPPEALESTSLLGAIGKNCKGPGMLCAGGREGGGPLGPRAGGGGLDTASQGREVAACPGILPPAEK